MIITDFSSGISNGNIAYEYLGLIACITLITMQWKCEGFYLFMSLDFHRKIEWKWNGHGNAKTTVKFFDLSMFFGNKIKYEGEKNNMWDWWLDIMLSVQG